MIRNKWGGARNGAGAPSKPPITLEEWEYAKANTPGRQTVAALARAINARRVGSAVDPRTIKYRSVSNKFVAEGIKMLKQSSFDGKEGLAKSGETDMVVGVPNPEYQMPTSAEPFNNAKPLMNEPVSEGNKPSTTEVDSEQPGAT